ncbi:hypothetical protein QBC46DRAFT_72057 [Diplogelasinospora grovesii]|uniref:Uncharacterized protein n=1 Tax=Diplogelasinospora grovesii TaxID=303347 RepID=A0AAN6S744_9PEZI|nr:hypothetical protein QBC46DRAFT_72057 [Diplogelasinospora grovesii]
MPLAMPRFPSLVPPSHPRELGSMRWASSSSHHQARSRSSRTMPFQLSFLHISAVVLLVLSSAILNQGRSTAAVVQGAAHAAACASHDVANPLAESFPNNATGVLNATLVIIPISLEAARRLIPPQYGILEQAYRALLPDFPKGMYPVMLQAAHDHDVQLRAYGITLDDFSRVGFEFPFLDLLGDGYSSFRWAPAQLISATNTIAVEGSRAYGTIVSEAEYDPLCDAYRQLSNGASYFKGSRLAAPAEFIEFETTRTSSLSHTAYPLELFKNITNQPTFANASTCDNMIRLFNTSMSLGEHAPVAVRGRVKASHSLPFKGVQEWTDVYGVQLATPFIENNYLDCRTMQGYEGTGGPGDSFIQTRKEEKGRYSNVNDL